MQGWRERRECRGGRQEDGGRGRAEQTRGWRERPESDGRRDKYYALEEKRKRKRKQRKTGRRWIKRKTRRRVAGPGRAPTGWQRPPHR